MTFWILGGLGYDPRLYTMETIAIRNSSVFYIVRSLGKLYGTIVLLPANTLVYVRCEVCAVTTLSVLLVVVH